MLSESLCKAAETFLKSRTYFQYTSLSCRPKFPFVFSFTRELPLTYTALPPFVFLKTNIAFNMKTISTYRILGYHVFLLALYRCCSRLLACIVFDKKSKVILIFVPWHLMCLFTSGCFQDFFSPNPGFQQLCMTCFAVLLLCVGREYIHLSYM